MHVDSTLVVDHLDAGDALGADSSGNEVFKHLDHVTVTCWGVDGAADVILVVVDLTRSHSRGSHAVFAILCVAFDDVFKMVSSVDRAMRFDCCDDCTQDVAYIPQLRKTCCHRVDGVELCR